MVTGCTPTAGRARPAPSQQNADAAGPPALVMSTTRNPGKPRIQVNCDRDLTRPPLLVAHQEKTAPGGPVYWDRISRCVVRRGATRRRHTASRPSLCRVIPPSSSSDQGACTSCRHERKEHLTLERAPGCIVVVMENCCGDGDEAIIRTRPTCPQCGTKGSPVAVLTAKAMLTAMALRRLVAAPLYFCEEPTCSAVYFTTDRAVYTSADVCVPVWQKEPAGARRICYCFDENEAAMARELVETGRCHAVQRVRDHIAADRCACEVRNPRGTCCLGNLTKAVARIESECASQSEK